MTSIESEWDPGPVGASTHERRSRLAITDAIASLKPAMMPRLDAQATPEAIMRAIRATGAGDP